MRYALKHPTDGYATIDEDSAFGDICFDHEVYHLTITFGTEKDAIDVRDREFPDLEVVGIGEGQK
jgi:hypothetical protein